MGKTITGVFPTRREVELAVEHLVQEYGIERTDIFIEPNSAENSAGVEPSGGDSKSGHPESQPDADAALNGTLIVSVDINDDAAEAVENAFRDAGAIDFSTR